jgi:hypothetical protein
MKNGENDIPSGEAREIKLRVDQMVSAKLLTEPSIKISISRLKSCKHFCP